MNNCDDSNKSYKHRKIEKCINNAGTPNYYDNNYYNKKKKESIYNNNIINFNDMNNNEYNHNNPNNHVNYPEEKQYNNYYSQRNGKNYYNNMNINKGGYIYKNYSTPKMMIQGQKDNFIPDPKKMPYKN